MRRSGLWWVLVLGCTDPPPPSQSTLDASCAVSADNVLQYECTVAVDPPGPVAVEFHPQDGSGSERVVTSAATAAEHTVALTIMAARTAYVWTASGGGRTVEGSFETEALPTSAQVEAEISGTASFPYVMLASPCDAGAAVVILTTEGETVWYHEFSRAEAQAVDAASFTEDGTVLVLTDDAILEVDLQHRSLLDIEPVVDFDRKLHHDVFRKDGITYALNQEVIVVDGFEINLDGYYAFDGGGQVLTDWKLSDHFLPPEVPDNPAAHDYTHANSVFVDDQGDVIMSMRHISAVAKIAGPDRPAPGEILWRISGNPGRMPLGTDYDVVSADTAISADFIQQHNVHVLPDGRFAMLDNRLAPDRSRVLVVSLDDPAGEARIEEEYRLPVNCDFQGSAWHAASGNPVGGCAPERMAHEFDVGVPAAPRWTMKASCFSGSNTAVPRFVPLEASQLP